MIKVYIGWPPIGWQQMQDTKLSRVVANNDIHI